MFVAPWPLLCNRPCNSLRGGLRGEENIILTVLIYTGTVVFQVLVGFVHLSMATTTVHCGATALIAAQAMQFSMYHADHSFFFQFQP